MHLLDRLVEPVGDLLLIVARYRHYDGSVPPVPRPGDDLTWVHEHGCVDNPWFGRRDDRLGQHPAIGVDQHVAGQVVRHADVGRDRHGELSVDHDLDEVDAGPAGEPGDDAATARTGGYLAEDGLAVPHEDLVM